MSYLFCIRRNNIDYLLSNLHGYELVASGSANEETIDVEQEIFDLTKYNVNSEYSSKSTCLLEIICITSTSSISFASQDVTHIVKYMLIPYKTLIPYKIAEINHSYTKDILFRVTHEKIFYTAKKSHNKYAIYINALPIQFIK